MLALSIFGAGTVQAQFIIDGTSLTVPPPLGNSPNTDLIVGNITTGALTIQTGGTVINSNAIIGAFGGSSGTVTVTGPGSTWTNNGYILVADAGTGTLTVQNGGTVSDTRGLIGNVSGSSGTVAVTGPGSTWTNSADLSVGGVGTGTLTIQNGGTVINSNGIIGGNGASGTVTVTGPGSTWTDNGDLLVADGGTGTLTVQNGGTVSDTRCVIGNVSGSSGTVAVTGAGSTWTNSADLSVGGVGIGTLTIQNGGTVSDAAGTGSNVAAVIGGLSGSSGTVTVIGPGSTWASNGVLLVADEGTGTLTIQSGGLVHVGGTVFIANLSTATGTLNIGAAPGSDPVAPGTLETSRVIFGSGTGIINFNHTATDYVFAPAISWPGKVNVLSGTTILAGDNTYSGGTTISAGTLQLGNGGTTGSIVGIVN
jgi:T5SS/PEP-CTERM-associated repeat protein/autotransporter-associated beta strand protein